MSIDAEMNSGVITEAEALRRGKEFKKTLIFMGQWMVPVSLFGEMLSPVYLLL